MVAVVDQVKNVGVVAYNFEAISYPLVEMAGVLLRVKPSGNLCGACSLIPHRTWDLLGDWCEDYGLYGEEDRDYGFRVSQAGLINAYMADEDIGDHLPAGKAALISAATLAASDGQEERSEADYRQWKDRQRSAHLKLLGAWERNQFAYSSGGRPLRVVSRFVAERKGAVGIAGSSATDSASAFALIAGSLLKRLLVSAKKLGRLLLAAQQNLGGGRMLAALMAALRVLRCGGLGALRVKALYFLNQTVNYVKWIALYDQLSNEDRRQIDERIGSMPCHPTFSILMPVYRPEPEYLEQAIESVLAQLYPYWELCIADDASDDPRIASLIDSYCQRDTRIKAMSRPQRGHISVASNSCLEMSTGEFVALLDHDDLLAPHALYMAAQALNHRPDLSLMYTDEDKINASGVRSWPHFKPDWNVDLMRSENAVNHLGIYRSAIVREVGGFRSGVEGCQDWDLALRVSECILASQILHLPYVLYHWRVSRQSTAVNTASKQYVVTAGQKILDDHLKRLGVNAEVLPQYGAYFRVKYRLDRTPPVAVISRFAAQPILERLIDGMSKGTAYPELTLYLLIETEQRAPLGKIVLMAQAKNLKLILIDCKAGKNSAERINYALSIAEQEVICLLDPECAPSAPDWLSELVSHAMRPEIGVAGPKLINPDGSVYSAGTILGMGASRVAGAAYRGAPKEERGAGGRAVLSQNYSAVAAQCLLFRRAVFHEAKGLDPALPLDDYGNVDFCLRLGELGYRVLWTPFAELVWHGSAQDNPENIDAAKIMRSRWQKTLDCDPAHNPNLSLSNPCPMLAPAPRVPRCSAYRPESSS
jgi:glycosyltransferase involved in cell wall biosynthesis/GT2 family glycosyltransferase